MVVGIRVRTALAMQATREIYPFCGRRTKRNTAQRANGPIELPARCPSDLRPTWPMHMLVHHASVCHVQLAATWFDGAWAHLQTAQHASMHSWHPRLCIVPGHISLHNPHVNRAVEAKRVFVILGKTPDGHDHVITNAHVKERVLEYCIVLVMCISYCHVQRQAIAHVCMV